MSELLASVVVPVRGDTRLRRCVDSLLRQTIAPARYEVIVVENGTRELSGLDGLAGVVRYLHLPRANSAAARNAGLAVARGRFLLFTDSDCVADPRWIEAMTAAMSNGATVVGGRIERFQPTTWTQRHAITIVDGQTALNYLPALHLPYVAGANAGFRTALVREAGGFDEDLLSGNDVDICYRLGLRGHQAMLEPAAVVAHEDRATVWAHFRRFRFYAVYQVLLFAKYRHVTGRRMVFDRYPFTRGFGALRLLPKACADLIRGDTAALSRGVLQMIEAAGVLAGELEGSLRFRQLYL